MASWSHLVYLGAAAAITAGHHRGAVLTGSAAFVSPGTWFKIQNLGSQPKTTRSESSF